MVLWFYGTLGSPDSSDSVSALGSSGGPPPSPSSSKWRRGRGEGFSGVPEESEGGFRMFFAGRMVLRLFLESHGTLAAVSAPLVMSLRDSDIPMNVPFTFRNKQPFLLSDAPWRNRRRLGSQNNRARMMMMMNCLRLPQLRFIFMKIHKVNENS